MRMFLSGKNGRKKHQKFAKKLLTKVLAGARMYKLSDERKLPGGRQDNKNLEKKQKVLDKFLILCYHMKVRCGEQSAPCKLNNVRRTIRTPWTIIMDCLRLFVYELRKNSQRKFLSKFARQIDRKMI